MITVKYIRNFFHSPSLWVILSFIFIAIILYYGISYAHAADTNAASTGGLPWDTPITTIRKDLSGPVAFAFALVGIFATGATLIWGGEISEFTRRMMYLVLVICILVFSNTLLTGSLFTGAMVPASGLSMNNTKANALVHHVPTEMVCK
ncbi:Conjugal transfer protein trbC [Granulibacter bethesdensis]|uniref:TrbC/VirB2 family protein n=1 Tax=Granulibacter bethesdensis TaxID=364410 RepID=UPI00090B23BF|nr:TrbC/VirB2 family protein [Granulibacter bethesdensis]APH57190.1 Conjugal transfer protein trbC [Granulibacter bethesdensis]